MAAQAAQVAQPKRTRKRKINEARVKDLALSGNSANLISKDQNVAPSTITRYLQSIGLNINELRQYKDTRADLKAILQAKAESKLAVVVDSIGEEEISAMSPKDKKDTMIGLTAVVDRSFTQEKTERGQVRVVTDYRGMSIELTMSVQEAKEAIERLRKENNPQENQVVDV